jgi:hypothetical protein
MKFLKYFSLESILNLRCKTEEVKYLKNDQGYNTPGFGWPFHLSALVPMEAGLREDGERFV